jgi:hypothetical protein
LGVLCKLGGQGPSPGGGRYTSAESSTPSRMGMRWSHSVRGVVPGFMASPLAASESEVSVFRGQRTNDMAPGGGMLLRCLEASIRGSIVDVMYHTLLNPGQTAS